MRFLYWLILAINVLMLIMGIVSGSSFILISVIGIGAAVVALVFDAQTRALRRRVEEMRSGWTR